MKEALFFFLSPNNREMKKIPVLIGAAICFSLLLVLALKGSRISPSSSALTKCDFKDLRNLTAFFGGKSHSECFKGGVVELTVKSAASLKLPPEFGAKVRKWLGFKRDLMAQLYDQKVLHAFNPLTGTTTAFNPLRSARPLPRTVKDPLQFVKEYVKESEKGCDLCDYKVMTAEDERLGRLESRYSASASNVFKFQDFHSLIFPKSHDALNLNESVFADLFNLTSSWFDSVHSKSPDHTHPQLLFDFTAHAGASQPHPHFQAFMGQGAYLGQFRVFDEAFKSGRNLDDYVDQHFKLGLGVRLRGDARVLTPLDAHKDHEFIVIAPNLESFAEAFFKVYKTYLSELGVYCWSSGFAFPSLDRSESIPYVAKIGSRGDCQSRYSDVSSLELYILYNVNTNPYQTIEALKSYSLL